MDRRSFLRRSGALAVATGFGHGFWSKALAAPASPGPGPYGPLGPSNLPDVLLPEGFTARVIAIGGAPVGAANSNSIDYVWPPFADGTATFPRPDGGWVLAVNSEVPRGTGPREDLGVPPLFDGGGCSSLVFDADGNVVEAFSILTGTDGNCAGGATPWGTWISCEEPQFEDFKSFQGWALGACYECDPHQPGQGTYLPAMGLFKHEAVAIDPVNGHAFLTEDEPDGAFYRFIPDAYPDLSAGRLQVAIVAEDSTVTWHDITDPLATEARTAHQVEGTTPFNGGEGCWYDEGHVYFTTKDDHRVWVHDIAGQTIRILYDAADHAETPLGPSTPGDSSVDNITVSSSGDLFVAEDGGNLEIVMISADKLEVAPIMRLVGDQHGGSEITGPSFSPDGSRLYFSSQNGSIGPTGAEDPTGTTFIVGNALGVTYEVTGPFRTERVGIAAVNSPGTVTPPAAPADAPAQPPPTAPATSQPAAADAAPVLAETGGGALAGGIAALAAAAMLRVRGR